MKNLPFVSICLLTYNRAHDLPQSIDSLLAQTHGDFELIINDDRSPDNTEEICREYEKKDLRVKYFKNETNLRYADNQNAAIERANSDYVAIVHDGDVYRPDLIEKWTINLSKFPSAALVFNQYKRIDPENGTRFFKHGLEPLSPGKVVLDEMFTNLHSPIFGIVMVRKSALQRVGRFDKRFPTLADVDMWMRLLSKYDVGYVSEPLITTAPREKGHYNNPGNIKVKQQMEHIFLLNAARYYRDRPKELQIILDHLQVKLMKSNYKCALWSIKRGQVINFICWIGFIIRSKSRWKEFASEGLR